MIVVRKVKDSIYQMQRLLEHLEKSSDVELESYSEIIELKSFVFQFSITETKFSRYYN